MRNRLLLGMVSLAMALQGCQDDDNVRDVNAGEDPILFDRSEVRIGSHSDSIWVKAIPQGVIKSHEAWGLDFIYLSENADTQYIYNSFDTIVVNEHEEYQMFKNQMVGQWYLIEKQDDRVFVKLQENTGDERSLRINVLGGAGVGSFTVIQDGADK